MALIIKTPPASEPVTLSEAKDYLRITDTDDDSRITDSIAAVRRRCEDWTGRAWITQTWIYWLDRFPPREKENAPSQGYFELPVDYFDGVQRVIEIPRPPLVSITQLKTYDKANAAATFDAANYLMDSASVPGRIALNANQSWPTELRSINAVEIEFVAGYGNAADVPEPVKEGLLIWIKLLFADMSKLYESDESTAGLAHMNMSPIPAQVKSLWDPYKLVRF